MASSERNYPMLESCRVMLLPEIGLDVRPVRLPLECTQTETLPTPYDFSLEREIIKKKEDREQEWGMLKASSSEELRATLVARMKSVTNATEDVCISLLKSNSYDLGDSIEAYLSR